MLKQIHAEHHEDVEDVWTFRITKSSWLEARSDREGISGAFAWAYNEAKYYDITDRIEKPEMSDAWTWTFRLSESS